MRPTDEYEMVWGVKMKMTQGYLTADGTFFESKIDAEFHEATNALRAVIPSTDDAERLFVLLMGTIPEVRRFINAYEATNNNRPDQAEVPERDEVDPSPAPEAMEGERIITGAEEDLKSLLKLPTRRPRDVPDVGSGSWPEEIPVRRKVDGA